MAPWVQKVFIDILPKLLCIERPKKDESNDEEDEPQEVLTDVFHLPPDVDKFINYDTKRFSGDYGIPGMYCISFKFFILITSWKSFTISSKICCVHAGAKNVKQ